MSIKEKEFQIRKKEGNEYVNYFPNTKANNTVFEDGESLQQKFNSGALGGSDGSVDGEALQKHINNREVHVTSDEKNTWNGTLAAAKIYADEKVNDLVNSAPEALDTLKELSNALGNDPNFATTVATEIGKKADKGHKHTKSEITDFPTSLPASGGNADTLGGFRPDDFVKSTGGTVRGALSVSGASISANNGNFYTNQYVQMEARAGHGAGVASMWYDSTNNSKILQGNNIKDLVLEGNKVYHEGRKPTASEIGARPSNWIPTASEVGALPLSGGETTGAIIAKSHIGVKRDTYDVSIGHGTNNIPRIRYGGTGAGATAGFEIVGSGDSVKMRIDENGDIFSKGTQKVYHTGNKPKAEDIGAAPTSHGTHVSYGTITSSLAQGSGGVLGTSGRVAREDHTHTLPAYPTLSSLGGLPLTGGIITGQKLTIGEHSNALEMGSTANGSWIGQKGQGFIDFMGDKITYGANGIRNKIYHEGFKPSASDIGAATSNHNHDSSYLKLGGGTISGNLSVSETISSRANRVSGYYSAGTGGDKGNYWFKMARFNVSGQYGDSQAIIDFIDQGTSGNTPLYGTIIARVKQQNPMGQSPSYSLYLENNCNCSFENFKLVSVENTTSFTRMELWMQIPRTYCTINFAPRINVNSIDFYNNSTLYQNPASGNSIIASRVNRISASDVGAYTKSEIDGKIANTVQGSNSTGTVDRGSEGANGITKSGFYRPGSNVTSEFPFNQHSGLIHCNHPSTKHAFQIGSAYNSANKLYFRNKPDSTSWNAWCEIYHTGYKPSASDIGALPVTGGTLTSDLTLNKYLKLNAWDSNYGTGTINLWADKRGNGVLDIDGASDININNNLVYHTNRKPTPSEIGAFGKQGEIGSSAQWNDIVTPGCYKVQMSSWGATNLNGPNANFGGLYSFGLLLVFQTNVSSEDRIMQIYFPHREDIGQPIVQRMRNSGGWQSWAKIGRGLNAADVGALPAGGGTISGNPAVNSRLLIVSQNGTTSNSPPLLAETRTDTNWGVAAELRTSGGNGKDRPSLLFSSTASSTNYTIGMGQENGGNNFTIKTGHGVHNGGWGTTLFSVEPSGHIYTAGMVYSGGNTTTNGNFVLKRSDQFSWIFHRPGSGNEIVLSRSNNWNSEDWNWGTQFKFKPDLVGGHCGIQMGASASWIKPLNSGGGDVQFRNSGDTGYVRTIAREYSVNAGYSMDARYSKKTFEDANYSELLKGNDIINYTIEIPKVMSTDRTLANDILEDFETVEQEGFIVDLMTEQAREMFVNESEGDSTVDTTKVINALWRICQEQQNKIEELDKKISSLS